MSGVVPVRGCFLTHLRNQTWRASTWLAADVIFVLGIAVVAAVYALAMGGSLETLAATQFRFVWLLAAGLVVQVGFGMWDPPWLSETGDLAVILGSNVLVAAFLGLNRRLPGMWLAASGLLLNVLVIGVNGAMPVSAEAAERAGFSDGANLGESADFGIKHEPLGPETALPWIADVIPIPGLKLLLSAGDVVLAAGIGWLVYRQTRRRPKHRWRKARPGEASDLLR